MNETTKIFGKKINQKETIEIFKPTKSIPFWLSKFLNKDFGQHY